MSSNVSIKSCLNKWLRKYGEEKVSRYGQEYDKMPIEGRKWAIMLFLRWMKMLGLEKEIFTTHSFYVELRDACFGTAPWPDKQKQANAHNALKDQLEKILDNEGIFEGKRFRKKSKRKLKITAESTPNNTPETPPQTKKETPKPAAEDVIESGRRYGKEMDKSLYADLPPLDVGVDEEMCKLLGIDPKQLTGKSDE